MGGKRPSSIKHKRQYRMIFIVKNIQQRKKGHSFYSFGISAFINRLGTRKQIYLSVHKIFGIFVSTNSPAKTHFSSPFLNLTPTRKKHERPR